MSAPAARSRLACLGRLGFGSFVILSSLWLCLALWIQAPWGTAFTIIAMLLWLLFALTQLGLFKFVDLNFKRRVFIYSLGFALALAGYFSLEPRQDRHWNPEVARLLTAQRTGDMVTLNNVRNFDWSTDGSYRERWEQRQYNLNDIEGVNILTSYWMGPQIAHTLVSFDFKQQAPLTFSIEIRKEQHERFSAIGGFFRQYELSLVAADEKDIIYTRTNVRGEQVYIFPVQMPKPQMQALFLEYVNKAEQLARQPKWYNTLTSNCTTLVFDMAQAISQQPLPSDYRLLASGYLPNYLHDLNALAPQLDMKTWYQLAHINPKVATSQPLSSAAYSALIRQGLPQP